MSTTLLLTQAAGVGRECYLNNNKKLSILCFVGGYLELGMYVSRVFLFLFLFQSSHALAAFRKDCLQFFPKGDVHERINHRIGNVVHKIHVEHDHVEVNQAVRHQPGRKERKNKHHIHHKQHGRCPDVGQSVKVPSLAFRDLFRMVEVGLFVVVVLQAVGGRFRAQLHLLVIVQLHRGRHVHSLLIARGPHRPLTEPPLPPLDDGPVDESVQHGHYKYCD